MKTFILSVFLVIAVVNAADDTKVGTPPPCPTIAICDRLSPASFAHNGCDCQVFASECAVNSYNTYYAPAFTPLSETNAKRCSCYATPTWIENPTSNNGVYTPSGISDTVLCAQWTDCDLIGLNPVTAANSFECKVFPNQCYLNQFNCNYNPKFTPSAPGSCSCKYQGLVIGNFNGF